MKHRFMTLLLILALVMTIMSAPVAAIAANTPATTPAPEKKVIALTFDDGPGKYTETLLDYLAEYDVKATFFVQGKRAANPNNAEIMARFTADGHEVANHSWNHANMRKLSARAIREDLEKTNSAIYETSGQTPKFFRPPGGNRNDTLRSVVAELNMDLILWDIDPRDWENHNSSKILGTIKKNAASGKVILLHDIHKVTVNTVPSIIKALKEQGYEFVTLSELFYPELSVTADAKQTAP